MVHGWLRSFNLSSGTREALKWAAAFLMLIDHVNAYAFAWAFPPMQAAGRLVLPIFGFVLAYNLASSDDARLRRALIWLLAFGLLAQPFSMMLRKPVMPDGGWWVLNILFTFAFAVAVVVVMKRATHWIYAPIVLLAFVVFGAFLEFHWFGVAYVVSSYYLCERRSVFALITWFITVLALTLENANAWALAAIPIIALLSGRELHLRRAPRWAFYVFYVSHLGILWAVLQAPR